MCERSCLGLLSTCRTLERGLGVDCYLYSIHQENSHCLGVVLRTISESLSSAHLLILSVWSANGDNIFISCTSDVAVVCVVGVLSRISSGVIVPPQESSFTVDNKGFQNKAGRGMSPGPGPCWGSLTAWLLRPRSHSYLGKARFVG